MALRKNATDSATPAADAATTTTTPAAGRFEEMEGDTTTTLEADEDGVTTPPPAATTTAVTAPKPNLPSPLSSKTAMKGLQWAIPASDLEMMGIGVFPRITVGLDGFSRDKETELGKRIKVAVLSWNPVWLVTAGEQDDPEANKLIRSSYDGINLMRGEGLVQDWLKKLKNDDYEKASVKNYIEIYCNLLEYEDAKGNAVVVDGDEQEIMQVSLSPQSVGQFQRYMLESGLRLNRGIVDDTVVVMTQNRKVLNNKKFGFATFSPK